MFHKYLNSLLHSPGNLAPDFPQYVSEDPNQSRPKIVNGIFFMKTFIVYNLDTRLPVVVGEAD